MFLIIAIICFIILFFLANIFSNNVPPGPIGIPVFGYLPFIGTQPHITFLERLGPRYGNIFSFAFGRKLAIVLNDWEAVKEAYTNQGKKFAFRPNLYLFNFMNKGHGIMNAQGVYWKNQRKFLNQALREILDNTSLDKIIMEELKYVYLEIDKNSKRNSSIDPHLLLQGCFVNMIASIVFGQRFEYDDPNIVTFLKLVHENFQLVGSKAAPLNFFPDWLNNKPLIKQVFGLNEFIVNVNSMTRFVVSQIQNHFKPFINHAEEFNDLRLIKTNIVDCYLTKIAKNKSNLENENKLPFCTHYKNLSTENTMFINKSFMGEDSNELVQEICYENEELNCDFLHNKDILSNDCDLKSFLNHGNQRDGFTGFDMIMSVMDIFLGGTETTQTVMRWAFIFMAKYQNIQEKVYEEVKAFTMTKNCNEENGIPHIVFSDREHLPYSQATVMEIQRRASIAPLGFFHSNDQDTMLNSYFIPKNSIIIANHWALHHDPRYWENPFNFEPSRFLDGDNSHVITDKPSYVPYSLGPRYCFGANVAKNELFTVFVNLILRYHFTFPAECTADASSTPYHDYSRDDDDRVAGNMALTWAPLPFKILPRTRNVVGESAC